MSALWTGMRRAQSTSGRNWHLRELVAVRFVERPGGVQIRRIHRLVAKRLRAVEILEEEVAARAAPVLARTGEPAVDVALVGEIRERAAQPRAARRVRDEEVRGAHG